MSLCDSKSWCALVVHEGRIFLFSRIESGIELLLERLLMSTWKRSSGGIAKIEILRKIREETK